MYLLLSLEKDGEEVTESVQYTFWNDHLLPLGVSLSHQSADLLGASGDPALVPGSWLLAPGLACTTPTISTVIASHLASSS